MDYKEKYSEYLAKIENRITTSIPNLEPNQLYDPFRYIMKEGGKRLRPILTMICAGLVGGNPDDAIDSAVAIEVLHNFTLVHDDIMDNSPIRRGRQTIHEKWDSPTAILTGDVMIGYAYKLLPRSTVHKNSDKILSVFTNELIEVCERQVLDMVFNEKKDVEIDDYINMIDKKTARLIETSSVIGALIGNGSDLEIQSIRKISHNIGLAFQIQDDLLDMTAKQEDFGKKIGKDIIEGKKTFLVLKAKEIIKSNDDRSLLLRFIENNGLNEAEVPLMNELFLRNGIYEIAQNEIDRYFDEAFSLFTNLKNNYYSEMLKWLLNSLNKRLL